MTQSVAPVIVTSDLSGAGELAQDVDKSLAGGANVANIMTDVAASDDSKESTPSPVSDASPSAQDEAIKRCSETGLIDVTFLPASQFIPKGKLTLPTQTKEKPPPKR